MSAKRFTRRPVAALVANAAATRPEPAGQSHTMPDATPAANPHAFEIGRLRRALAGDFRALSLSYPILADHGLIERTSYGYRDPGGECVVNRCRELLARLEGVTP
ncbi:hypothetical protein EB061_11415 [bacterium]|nr:hypothetical protein [bacterium]